MRIYQKEAGMLATGLAVFGFCAWMIGTPIARADTPYEQAKGVVQEMLGQAIMADVMARSPQEKALAQERLGYAIMNQAMITLGEQHLERSSVAQTIQFAEHPGRAQEMLGLAIVDAALAGTPYEQGKTQEILGLMIVNSTLLGFGDLPVGMGGETPILD